MNVPILYIDKPDQVEPLCERIAAAPWIAVDTEFVPEKTYYPDFCLLQLATPQWAACVDPLALPDMDRIFAALCNPAVIKVFHSCYADLKIIFQWTGQVPTPVFDTQVAARFLGYNENTGYAQLVSSFLNIHLDKAHTRADWSRRPLSEGELRYAADDVIHLCSLYEMMIAKLADLGRMEWAADDLAALEDPGHYQNPPENAWKRFRGIKGLSDASLSVLQAVAQWREATAQRENCPLNYLIRDELVLDIAKQQPVTVQELMKIRSINQGVVKVFGQELAGLIRTARTTPPTPLPERTAAPRSQAQEALLDILNALVRIRAEVNQVNPGSLATRHDLEALVQGDESCLLLRGWRWELAGRELQRLLRGEVLLKVENGVLNFASGQDHYGHRRMIDCSND